VDQCDQEAAFGLQSEEQAERNADELNQGMNKKEGAILLMGSA